jgi:hypothetical protein
VLDHEVLSFSAMLNLPAVLLGLVKELTHVTVYFLQAEEAVSSAIEEFKLQVW